MPSKKSIESRRSEDMYIYGRHVLEEALTCEPLTIKKVFLSSTIHDTRINAMLKKKNITVVPFYECASQFIPKEAVHQGVIAIFNSKPLLLSLNKFLDTINIKTNPALVLLDEVQDPRNVGAVIRSAAAFGASGVLIPTHNQAGITAGTVKSSAGMIFRIPIISIKNVNQTVRILKERGFWIYSLDMSGDYSLIDEAFSEPSVLILGNEKDGVRKRTKELTDILIQIPIESHCESLNVASAASIALYAWHSAQLRHDK